MSAIANIIPTTQIPLNKPQYFSYSILKDLEKDIKPGIEVKIPLGKKKISGVVFNIVNSQPKFKLKNILEVTDKIPVLSTDQLKLAGWISKYYYTSLGIVIKTMLPKRVGTRKHESVKLSKEKFPFPKLTKIQNEVYESIKNSKEKKFLIYGVTGSGKTEIYLKLIKDTLNADKQVIFLVPEISLTPQTVQKIASRFDHHILALLHSNLSAGEKYKIWQNIRDKKIKIIIGPRSAILTPIQDLGLIIIDEEHDQSYKQYDQNPQYHVKDVASKLSELTNCKVILGSATPSIETYYQAKSKRIKLLEMPERFQGGYDMPKVQIVDMRVELKKKNFSIFSEALQEELEKTLNNKKQALLFINRRGTSTFVMCRDCGHVLKCPHCDVPLVYHSGFSNSNNLNCHYCNYGEKIKSECPKCNSKYIKYFGAGTERIESEFKAQFPGVRVARMDKDTMNTKFAHFKTFNDFLTKKYNVLIGTQMITKGFDLPNIDLIGIISADTCLNLPDFKSFERTFQLITQVAGRTGRGQDQGKVILQTYNPENKVLKAASKHDFKSFYDLEIVERNNLNYPPFSKLIKLTLKGKDHKKIQNKTINIAKTLSKYIKDNKLNIDILGPSTAFIPKKRGEFIWQIILKIKKDISLEKRNKLLSILSTDCNVDIDPESLL